MNSGVMSRQKEQGNQITENPSGDCICIRDDDGFWTVLPIEEERGPTNEQDQRRGNQRKNGEIGDRSHVGSSKKGRPFRSG